MTNTGRKTLLAALCGATAWLAPTVAVWADAAYVVGMSAAVTGRGSGTYGPVVEAIKLYLDGVNAEGGVNGHPVRLVIEDNQAQPSRAAADAKKFANDSDVILVMNASLSSTYAPMIAEGRKAGMALLFAGGVCPKETYPPADKLLFCSTAFGAQYDSRFALDFIKENADGPVKLGLVAMAIPVSRGEIDYAEGLSKTLGMEPVNKEAVPPPTPDYSPFATKLKEAGANWVYSWAPWVTQVKTFEALRKQGWTGKFLTYAHGPAEDELVRLKDEGLYVFGNNAFFQDDLGIHNEIRAAAKKGGTTFPVSQLAEGWISAMALEAVLQNVSWPPSRDKVVEAMSKVAVDTNGLRGGPLVWNASNHFRTNTFYRVYRWDDAKQSIVQVKDWTGLAVE